MIKQCVICGKEFKPTEPRQCTCSPACKEKRLIQQLREAYQRYSAKRKIKALKAETCHICGRKFQPSFFNEHYCSDECREQSPLWQLAQGRPEIFTKFFSAFIGD